MFEQMEIAEYIYEVVVEPSYKTLLGKPPTVLVTAGKIDKKPPHHILTPRWLRSLVSAENDM